MTDRTFGGRLAAEFAAGRHLCVGIDPHAPLLADWGLADDAAGAERMGRVVVEAAAGLAACVKPQIAFFERFGSAGFAALERVLSDARAANLLVIADVKRGDIGTSFAAYGDAWLTPGSPLESDAMTVSAYQGFGTLTGALRHVREHGKGVFVLAATSNPEAREVQMAQRMDGKTVAAAMVDDAAAWNRAEAPREAVGSVGVVLGATLDLADFGIDTGAKPDGPALPVLAPGFGHQGGRVEEARTLFGGIGHALLANESRSILAGGSAGITERIRERGAAIADALDDRRA
ncbi:orotidine-5'-phosphate decarboxylase [Leucobacter sp. CSA2]|uniref:Orotidine-5'-phosphate decarboxylase n=1 Tax=Leucobacter edaphi TaxID=2796472 RepID=A0A934QB91_9MICO|nr:orotidine-5'-phosphate decarboxylase [Leucobacter edaphi]MBK0421223.1 orotidine-5'-phosphate decarboxylase [Leucobacter edaphi]